MSTVNSQLYQQNWVERELWITNSADNPRNGQKETRPNT